MRWGASPIGKGHRIEPRPDQWRRTDQDRLAALNPTNHGYKVTDVIVNGISTASTQHSDLVSVIQRHNGQLPCLLVALREKNVSNGIVR
jgi:hypothetical protein